MVHAAGIIRTRISPVSTSARSQGCTFCSKGCSKLFQLSPLEVFFHAEWNDAGLLQQRNLPYKFAQRVALPKARAVPQTLRCSRALFNTINPLQKSLVFV